MEVSEAKRLKALEEENAKLKKLWPNRCWMWLHFASFFQKNVWVRPVRARVRDIANDDSSCINVSGLSRVGCGCSQAMIDPHPHTPFPINGSGTKPAFLHRTYGMLIHCFVITIPALQSSLELQVKAGSLRS